MNAARLALEEGMKRQVNEAIEAGLWPDERQATVRMRCECGSPECNRYVQITVPEYEQVRAHARRFVLAAGHDDPTVERVVERTAAYLIVEKTGDAAGIAEGSDPRARPDQAVALESGEAAVPE